MRAKAFLLFIAGALTIGPAIVAQNASPNGRAKGAHVKALRAAVDTDVVPDEVFLASDSEGHTRLFMGGPLPKNGRERMFWVVDRSTGEYRILRLSGDGTKDAERIAGVYRKLGVDIPAQHIAANLLPESQRLTEQLQRLEEQTRQRTRPVRLDLPNRRPSDEVRISPASFVVDAARRDRGRTVL